MRSPVETLPPLAPPQALGPAGQSLWDRIQYEWRIDDAAGIELLAQACCAADRAQSLAAVIEQDGPVIRSNTGVRAHPCLRDELAARSFVVRTLQRLGLTEEAIKSVGRPSRQDRDSDAD